MLQYREILPSAHLQKYIKCFYEFETESHLVYEDVAYATGCMEIMFNMGDGTWQTITDNGYCTNPGIEIWGQVIQPLQFRSAGKNKMLGIRLFPYTASLFIREPLSFLNNNVSNGSALIAGIEQLHQQLLNLSTIEERINKLENFFYIKLFTAQRHADKLLLIENVSKEITQDAFFENINSVASRYNISSRYLQKLFLQFTGITPKLFNRIHRFKKSLALVSNSKSSLTSIAYDCDYFDQAHFIKEFKSFTGTNPSSFDSTQTSASLITI